MALLLYRQELSTCTQPEIFIETGTFQAENVVNLAPLFRWAYSIELSPSLYRDAFKRFGSDKIKFCQGNSAEVLPELFSVIHEPVVLYLDAHYCGGSELIIKGSTFPLWKELESARLHPYADLVIVDDVHTFGRERPDLTAHESGRSWEHVTEGSILEALGDRVAESYVFGNEFVVHLGPWKGE